MFKIYLRARTDTATCLIIFVFIFVKRYHIIKRKSTNFQSGFFLLLYNDNIRVNYEYQKKNPIGLKFERKIRAKSG